MTKVLVIASEKGGLGRTTWAKHLGCVLAAKGYRVVAVDTDTQGSLTYEFGVVVNVEQGDRVLYDFINRKQPFSTVVRQIAESYYRNREGRDGGELWLMPSNEETMHVSSLNADSLFFRSRINQMKLAKDNEGKPRFDIILIDTSPAPGMIHPPIYKAGDGVLLLAVPEASPVRQLYQTIEHLKNVQLERGDDGLGAIEIVGILPNRVRRRVALHEMFLEEIYETFENKISIFPAVYDHIAWAEASHKKKSVTVSHPESEAARMAWEIATRIEVWMHK